MATNSQASNTISQSMLVLLRARDPQGWAHFVDLYGPWIYGRCRRAGVSETDAADLTQQIFTKVLRGVGGFRKAGPEDSFRGWLARVCQNATLDHFRARQGQPVAEGGTEAWQKIQRQPADDSHSSVSPTDPERGDLARRAWELIAGEFSETARRAFELIVLDGRSAVEVAEQLKLTPASVRMSKSRILRRLREVLGEVD